MESLRGRVAAAVLAGLLLCSLFVGIAIPGGSAATARASAAQSGFGDIEAEAFDADRTLFRITVFENASAEWTFRYEQRLDDDEAATDFEAFAERFNNEETDSYRNFRTRATSLAASGSNTTNREMTAESFDRSARIEERSPAGDEFAVVEMSFVWTAFAAADGDRLVVGDVFVGGLYVGPDQQLRFDPGPDLRFESVSPEPDSTARERLTESESVAWLGERQFTDRQPRVVYAPRGAGGGSTPTPATTEAPDRTPAVPPHDAGSFLPIVALAIALVVGFGAAVAYRSGGLSTVGLPGVGSSDDHGETTADDSSNAVESAPAPTDRAALEPAASGTDGEDAISPALPEEQLRSDEERVVALLESHGGRMKQVDIVGNMEWSKSKVSMLLSEMEDDGVISKLRVGRENIVSLAGHEPDAAGSPFDEER
ncbi:helix-turn-helix transcriptional regulator [Natronomonas salsuginis]|jgi:hypothetical protein|uniref:helix-turn-helix transcriptional regulator n=1 Tax=Natronomonas salsuginis TaxID=2217661 RepID=UPI001FE8C365|nr:hypothetical protein [Natronomonas salsuginis]